MKKLIFILLLSAVNSLFAHSYLELQTTAKNSLDANIVKVKDRFYLRAGANHFGSLWTRDFAYSTEGLLSVDRAGVVKDHLEKLFSAVRKDGLVPRVFDNMKSKDRVFKELTGGKGIPLDKPGTKLKAEYKGEHGTIAMDSNVLVLRSAILYMEATGDQEWFQQNLEALNKIYRYYDHQKNDRGYIVQDDYGDWQDSVKRKGVTFLTNFHYWWVSNKLKSYPLFNIKEEELDAFRKQLTRDFLHPEYGVFSTHEDFKNLISLDGNLFALLSPDFFEAEYQRKALYLNLKKHPIWSSRKIPGSATYPNYPSSEVSFNVQVALLTTYHGKTMWSWLMGLSAKTAYLMDDQEEGLRILDFIQKMAQRDGVIAEIYNYNNKINIKNTATYNSERPFSWGSAFIVDAIKVALEN